MIVKKWKSYYFKLTVFSILILMVMILLIMSIVLFVARKEQKQSVLKEYNTILKELVTCNDDIQGNYYKVFIPLYANNNRKVLGAFCKSKEDGGNLYTIKNDMKYVFHEICSQDKRIRGIYFYNFSDGSKYLYLDDRMQLKQVDFELGSGNEVEGEWRRFLLGGMKVDLSSGEENVLGVQSGALTVEYGEETYTYRLTVLYSLDYFDEVFANHQKIQDARFLLTSQQGKIYYDSFGKYVPYQEHFYEEFDQIRGVGDSFFKDGVSYLKGEYATQSDHIAFYVVPLSGFGSFRLNGTLLSIVFMAVLVTVLAILIMLENNRMVDRRFQTIACGLEQIGQNKLEYRIPGNGKEDEFALIAEKFNQMCDVLEQTIKQNYVYQIQQKNAEYKALQKSVNPHFLYNSLELIREKMIEDGQEDCSEMIVLLSRIFEYQLREGSIVSIRKELGILRTYIEFFSVKSQYAFKHEMVIEERVMDSQVPKLIFQPILENYFVHGFRGDGSDCIKISGYLDEDDGRIHICFRDNGKGITEDKEKCLRISLSEEEKEPSHIGLYSVHSRLKLVYGKDSYLEIRRNAPDPGVSVFLVFDQVVHKLNGFDKGER